MVNVEEEAVLFLSKVVHAGSSGWKPSEGMFKP